MTRDETRACRRMYIDYFLFVRPIRTLTQIKACVRANEQARYGRELKIFSLNQQLSFIGG